MTDFDEKRIDQIWQNGIDQRLYSLADNFEIVPRMYDFVWVHKTKSCWIVHYPVTQDRAEFYEAYKVTEKLKAHHKIWAHDNKKISNGSGFKTLEESMQAVESLQ